MHVVQAVLKLFHWKTQIIKIDILNGKDQSYRKDKKKNWNVSSN